PILLLSDMTVDTALRNNWFSGTYWALPLRDAAQNLDLDTFRQQLQDAGLASESERDSLSLEQKVFTGTLRDQSFTAATLPNISLKQQPVIIHIDLSYFQPFYKNEISTPLYSIIFETMTRLKSMQLETLAVTFSYNHSDNQIALDVRFLGEMLQWLIEDPSRLEQKIPLKWQRQRDALYLANFFKKEEVRELYLAQEKDDPEAAWVKFNLYRSAVEHKEGNKALDYLSQAVELDSAYADEYFALSTLAYERGRPDESLRMLKLASNVFPNDPFVTIQMAQIANELGDKETALHLVKQLQMLVWSEFYYSDMPQYLEGFLDVIESETTQEPADSNDAEGNTETARERTLHLN
ncbi:MAG: hypothetical protein OET90_11900, partial [Desulfuromonadales bacterium]|nr:hypothetical protein [Desulfuromonadales bacterium]